MQLNKAVLISKKNLTQDVVELHFQPSDPGSFFSNFKAGKFISIKVPGEKTIFRSYSISGTDKLKFFDLCVKVVESGTGSNFLNNLEENSEIEFLGPNGHFVFDSQEGGKNILIATGTGIAPMKAFIEDELESKRNKAEFNLLFGVRYIKDIFYQDLLEKLSQKHSNFKYTIAISRPEDNSLNNNEVFFRGRVTDLLKNIDFSPTNSQFYICGLKDMVNEVSAFLKDKGLAETSIHFERFN